MPPPPHPWQPPHPAGHSRRRSRWLTVGLPVGAGLALLGALGFFVLSALGDLASSLGPAQDGAAAYAEALVDERWDDAHDLLCSDSQRAVTAADLAAHYGARELDGYRIDGVNVRNSNGVESAQVGITFTTASGLDDVTTIPLAREGGRWRPCP